MSSILTNNSAMVALQTLKSINAGLAGTQNEISTGKSIATAKDNAAIWAISKVMESDVESFKGIADSLSLGQSTVAVARQGAETITDLLTQMKGKIVAAQEDNVDRGKLQEDIVALRDQIASVVSAAQFNGLNLLDGSQTGFNVDGNVGVNILASLDRDAAGGVSVSNIGVEAQDLSNTAGATLTSAAAVDIATITENGGANDTTTFSVTNIQGGGVALARSDPSAAPATVNNGFIEGDTVRLTIGSITGSYTIRTGDDAAAIVTGIRDGLRAAGIDETSFGLTLNAGTLEVENLTNVAGIAASVQTTRGTGAMAQLDSLNVSTEAGATAALGSIEGMIQASIDAAAAFGSAQGRIDTQSEFVSKLTDALKSGIGAMVDADMEEASARLQALQVQQQLAVQALSIANQSPQTLLALFR